MGKKIESPFRVPGSGHPACRLLALQTAVFLPTAAIPYHAALISSEDPARVWPVRVLLLCAVLTGFASSPEFQEKARSMDALVGNLELRLVVTCQRGALKPLQG